ncbi:hypothetical protein BT93_L0121 [Corymbia citriodora subsp. variegata]|uniref:Uncharacterized protein n=1 Tax=Corymbia citriodora subsp. variegata TaxID=360336 RepID=A0A8T0CGP8_CORYI|nr:hypothetical protein BT93_L0121 [Corymbia citriodora subsp. variegata]
MRTFCKTPGQKNIPIQAIGLSLYEELGEGAGEEQMGKEVVRTQWLDFSTLGSRSLLGRRILIVDEVDDTRTTLAYAVKELQADLAMQRRSEQTSLKPSLLSLSVGFRSLPVGNDLRLTLSQFIVHNKLKPKIGHVPESVRYFSGEDLGDVWVDYRRSFADSLGRSQLTNAISVAWEMTDIDAHDALAAEQKKLAQP